MVPTELTFFEVKKEFVFTDAVEFQEAMFSKAPEGFDAVDVVLSPSKFVFMVMNPMMTESAGHQTIVGLPAVSVNVALGKDVPPEDRH